MKYPHMYQELREHIQVLSDKEYQIRAWVHGELPPGVQGDNFDLVIHFLFDDTRLAVDPESTIGRLIKNEAQARAVKNIVDRIDKILDDNDDLTDEEYIALPEWEGVVTAAKEALEIFDPLE